MRSLVWKEMRVLRAWLLGGVALIGALELLVALRVFAGGFVSAWTFALMPLVSAALAIGLASGQIARERHARTLEFLLARPVRPGTIVWAKFAVGTVVLAVLLAGAVALCYALPGFVEDTGLRMIREQVSLVRLMAALLPRFWFVYAFSLLFSVLVDRPAKAAALAIVATVTAVALAMNLSRLAPFSRFVFWLPFFDPTGGLVEGARSWGTIAMTGAWCAGGAILVTALAAWMLERSPERYLGDFGLAVAAALTILAAMGSSAAASHRLPVVSPAGWFEFSAADAGGGSGIAASGNMAALSFEHHLRILDFSRPARPSQLVDIEIPMWSNSTEWNLGRMSMQGDTVFLVGQRKMLPVDGVEITMANATGQVNAISLGFLRAGDYISTPLPNGPFLYAGVTRDRVCSLLVFDIAARREVAAVEVDRMRPPMPGVEEGSPPVRLLRRGRYLYLASPSYLTTIDVADAGRPVITGQIAVRPKVSFLYGFPRPMAFQGDRLFDIRMYPESLASYDLRDPAHPAPQAELTFHASMTLAGTGRAMYLPWLDGVLEFRAQGSDLKAERYLVGDGGPVSTMAMAGDSVYALTAPDERKRVRLEMFRVQ